MQQGNILRCSLKKENVRISLEEKELRPLWKQRSSNMSIEDDPILGRFFDTPEKKARWVARLRIAYILWIIFVIIGIISLAVWYFLK